MPNKYLGVSAVINKIARRMRVFAISAVLSALTTPALAHNAGGEEGAWTHEIVYTADVTAGLSGVDKKAGRFLDNLDVILDGDLEAAFGWKGARAHLYLLNNSGGAPNDLIGTLQGVDNIEVPRPRARLYELWIEQSFADDRAALLMGLYDLNSEFYSTEASDLLINPSFGIGSEFASTGPNGPSIFPSTTLAARLRVGDPEGVAFQAAVLNADAATLGDPGGPDMGLDEGALVVGEAAWNGPFRLAAGAWGYTERQDDVRKVTTTGDPARRRARGGYALAEGRFAGDDDRGASAFVRLGLSDGDTTPFTGGWQAGVKVQGVFEGRPDSAFSVGVQQAFLSRKARANGRDEGLDLGRHESGVELTYADTFGRITIQPDVQVIFHPGGERGRDHAIVGALRFSLDLS